MTAKNIPMTAKIPIKAKRYSREGQKYSHDGQVPRKRLEYKDGTNTLKTVNLPWELAETGLK